MSLSEDLKYFVVNNVTSQSHLAESCAKRFHEAHTRAGECPLSIYVDAPQLY